MKIGLGKLKLSQPFETSISDPSRLNQIDVLGISVAHAAAVIGLPLHHRDPFDRLLVAQSLTEGVPIVSADGMLDAYSVTRIWWGAWASCRKSRSAKHGKRARA